MKIKSQIIVILLLGIIACESQSQQLENIEKYNLKGNIESIVTNTFTAEVKDSLIIKSEEPVSFSNNLIYEITDDNYLRFNEKGSLLEKIIYRPKNEKYLHILYNYNNSDIEVELKFTPKNEDYDENGNLIRSQTILENGLVISEYNYKYDKSGNLIQTTDMENFKSISGYSKENKMEYYHELDENGIITYKDSISYDEFGNREQVKIFNLNKKTNKLEHTSTAFFKHDQSGNILEGKRITLDGKLRFLVSRKYTFDKNGNWIKMIVFNEKIPKFIVERKINYYQ